MLSKIRQSLAPPVFEDEEQNRMAGMLYAILATMLIAVGAVSMVNVPTGHPAVAYVLIASAAVILCALWLARRGHLRTSGFLFLLTLLGVTNYLLFTGQGIHDTAVMLYPVTIIAASLLLGRRGSVTISLLTVFSACGIVLSEIAGSVYTRYGDLTYYDDLVAVSVILIATAVVTRLLANRLVQSLRSSRRNERALAETNRQLEQQAKALRESEERYRLLFECAADAIFLENERDEIVDVNRRACELLGYTRQELLAMKVSDIQAPEARGPLGNVIRNEWAQHRDTAFESVDLRRDERRIPVEVSLSELSSQGERLMLSIVRDITERKRAEQVQAALYRISEAAQSARDLDELYRLIHAIIGQLMPAKNFFIALYDAAADLFTFPYYADELDVEWLPIKPDKSLTGYVLRTGKPLLASSQIFEQLVLSGQVKLFGAPSVDWLGVPLNTERGTIGVMVVQTYSTEAHLAEADKAVLMFVSTQVAMAIERKRTVEALRKSEQRLNLAQAVAHVGSWELNVAARTMWGSDEAFKIYGLELTPDHALPLAQVQQISHAQDRPRLDAALSGLLTRDSPYDIEFRIRRVNDGETRVVHSMAQLLKNDQGQPVAVVGTIQDITERKCAEEALAHERALLRTVIDLLPDSIYAKDMECRKTLTNRTDLERMGAHSETEALAKTDFDFFSQDVASKFYADDQIVLQTGQPLLNREEMIVTGDGQLRWLLTSKVPLRTSAGQVVGLVGVGRDITERKRAEEALQESEQRFRTIIEQASEGFVLLDEQGAIIEWNPAQAEIWALERDEVYGRPFWEVQFRATVPERRSPERYEYFKTVLLGALETGQSPLFGRIVEGQVYRPDGERRFIQQSIFPIKTDQGYRIGSVTHDITDRRQAEEALRESQTLLSAIVENLPFEFWACGPDGRYVMQNALDINLWGNLIGKTLEELGLPEDELALWRASHRCAFAGEFVHGEHERFIKGEKRNYYSLIGPIRDGDVIRGILGIRIDITDRKRAEEQVRNLNRTLRVINEVNQALVRAAEETELLQRTCHIITDIGGYRLAWVGFAEQDEATLRAVRPVAAAGEDASLLDTLNITRADSERGRGPIATAIRTGQPVAIKDIAADANNSAWRDEAAQRGYASSIALPLMSGDKALGTLNIYAAEPNAFDEAEIRLLAEMADDMAFGIMALRARTAQLRAEEEIERLNRDLERRARGLAALNKAGQIMASTLELDTLLNRVLEQIQSLLEAEGASVLLCEDVESQAEGSQLIFSAATGPSAKYLIGMRLPAGAGVAGWVVREKQSALLADVQNDARFDNDVDAVTGMSTRSLLAVPLIFKGTVLGLVEAVNKINGTFDQHDLEALKALSNSAAIAIENARLFATEQQRAKELAHALEQQRQLDRIQREFIQNVSHELRTPLALVRGHAELLEGGWLGELQSEQKDSVGVITRRARILSKLVDDIVGVLEVEQRILKREPVDLVALVRMVMADFASAAKQSGLTLSAEIAPNVPFVNGDSIALRHALDNLVGNALKFTPSGGRVTVQLSQSEDAILLQVSDTGIGIPADQLDRIFERFYQVNGSTTRPYGGVGLGLSLVKEIVEAHSGHITVESQVGMGSTFTVFLSKV